MPLALLLDRAVAALRRGADRLAPWNQIVALEELLLDRARGAFLVNWFGTRLPLNGSSPRVAIANLDELRVRYQRVRAASAPAAEGINLTEPLAGWIGSFMGTLLAPPNNMLVGALVARLMPRWWAILGAVVNWLTYGVVPLLIPALAALLLPFAPLFLIVSVLDDPEAFRRPYELLGALAGLLVAATDFLQQLLGPREGVRNPLVVQVLELLDRVATLLPFLMALFAILITRVGPLLQPLAAQLRELVGLIAAVGEVLGFIVGDFLAQIAGLFDPEGPLLRALGVVLATPRRLVATLQRGVERLLDLVTREVESAGLAIAVAIGFWLLRAGPAIAAATTDHPFVRNLLALKDAFMAVARAMRSIPPRPPPPPSSEPSTASRLLLVLPPVPTPPSLTPPTFSLPMLAVVQAAVGGPPGIPLSGAAIGAQEAALPPGWPGFVPMVLSPDAQREVERIRRPRSLFAAERAALRDSLGRTPAEALAAAREAELPYRQALTEIVERILPERVREMLPSLAPLFRALDENFYRRRERELPVRELPESDRLRPVVRRVVVRAPGQDSAAVNTWTQGLVGALSAQSYLAPAGS
ncbi:MAG TPA: hypothetical protein VGM69_04845 [Chloroflexota bacterium]|jgi:hypothetical protein